MAEILKIRHKAKEDRDERGISSLYVLKGICSFLVVACHTPMEQVLYLEAINAAAVPLFFMITGYFLFHDNAEVTYRNIVKAIKRIMPIIIILQVVYYPFAPIHEDLFRGWVLYARLVFMGFHSFKTIHLWYLTALLEGLVFFAVYLKIFKKKGVGCLVALSITGILLGRYRFLGERLRLF